MPTPQSAAERGDRAPRGPLLVPCLMLAGGKVMLPGEGGPVVARDAEGRPLDPLDVTDHLNGKYTRLYLVDLDGIDHDRPQLDYLQEISRDGDVWIDAGVKTGDQAIDVLVAGARRAVLSTAHLRSPKELEKAWKLSPDLVFEVEVDGGKVNFATSHWADGPATEVAETARQVGVPEIVLSPRGGSVDWALVRSMAAGGPVWVAGSFDPSDARRLTEAGAAGGIFHIAEELKLFVGQPPVEGSK